MIASPQPRSKRAARDGLAPSVPSCPCGGGDHFVQFYEQDSYLNESVARFLNDGFQKGARAVVIATKAHATEIDKWLATAGCPVGELIANRRYVQLDADATLARFCRNGIPDETRFREVIGGLVAELAASGDELWAFGEMVALLWERGKPDEAIRLEEFWNRLAGDFRFKLFCAYSIKGFTSHPAARHFADICRTHQRVIPTEAFQPQAGLSDEQLRQVAALQQRAAALAAEMAERTRAEEKLRQRERELTAFVESATIGLHWVDADGRIIWANRAELELLGYNWDEYVGHHISEFHADAPTIDDILTRLCRGEKLREYEARVRCKDGTIKTVLIDSSVLWDGDRFVHTQCFSRDVTEQRRVESASRHGAAIVEGSDDAIISKNLDSIILSWNPAAERIFGYRREDVIGKSITLLIPEERLHEEDMILGRLRRGDRIEHYETVRRRKDGTFLDVSLTISPMRDAQGRIVGASKIARDITEQKANAQALARVREQLAASNLALEERVRERTASLTDLLSQMETFSYTVSHDLRAPLRAMSGYARILQSDYAPRLDEEGAHFVDRIIRSCDRMNRMITDVLAYARVNRDRLDLQPLSLSEIATHVVQQSLEFQSAKAIVIPADTATVLGNEAFLTQIFANLFGNALKFIAPEKKPEIAVTFQNDGDFIRTEVRDNGIGIKPEHQTRLFGLFERVTADKRYEGTGIGLAIVKRAVERMGGTVGVDSDGVNGSRFWFKLPAAARSDESVAAIGRAPTDAAPANLA